MHRELTGRLRTSECKPNERFLGDETGQLQCSLPEWRWQSAEPTKEARGVGRVLLTAHGKMRSNRGEPRCLNSGGQKKAKRALKISTGEKFVAFKRKYHRYGMDI